METIKKVLNRTGANLWIPGFDLSLHRSTVKRSAKNTRQQSVAVIPRKRSFEEYEGSMTLDGDVEEPESQGDSRKSAKDKQRNSETQQTTVQDSGCEELHAASQPTEEAAKTQGITPGAEVYFFGEDADDYTYGDARMISTFDTSRNCTALLMTLDLSQKIQRALNCRLRMEADKVAIERRIKFLYKHQDEVEWGSPEWEMIRAEINMLANQRREARLDQEEVQAEADAILLDVFVRCGLMAAPSTDPVRHETVAPQLAEEEMVADDYYAEPKEVEYVETGANVQDEVDAGNEPNLESQSVHQSRLAYSFNDKERKLILANAKVRDARGALHGAQAAFDDYGDDGHLDDCLNFGNTEAGSQEVEDQEEFDLQDLRRKIRITGELVAAEKELKLATQELEQLEAELGVNQAEEYAWRLEEIDTYLIKSAPRKRIENWLNGVACSEPVTTQAEREVIETEEQIVSKKGERDWEEEIRSLAFGECLTTRDFDNREAIDEWHEKVERASQS